MSRIAIACPEVGLWVDLALKDTDQVDALTVLSEALWNALVTSGATHVAIEQPIVGASLNLRVGVSMGMVAGALCITARQAGATVYLPPPATWKKAVTGRGNASKQEVDGWLSVHHPDWHTQCSTQDTIDATCLSLYAQGLLA